MTGSSSAPGRRRAWAAVRTSLIGRSRSGKTCDQAAQNASRVGRANVLDCQPFHQRVADLQGDDHRVVGRWGLIEPDEKAPGAQRHAPVVQMGAFRHVLLADSGQPGPPARERRGAASTVGLDQRGLPATRSQVQTDRTTQQGQTRPPPRTEATRG